MTTLVLDQSFAEKLAACNEVTMLRDPQGNLIGVFDPKPVQIYEEGEIPPIDEAELRRRAAKRDGIPSAEVRRMLENLL